MHVQCVLKLKAEDEEEALQIAQDWAERSIDIENNNTGWDYASDEGYKVITPAILKSEYNLNTFKELEEYYEKQREESIKEMQSYIRRDVLEHLSHNYLTQKEAPLLLNDEDGKEVAEKLLKRKTWKTRPLPQDFLSLVELVTQTAVDLARGGRQGSLFEYYIKQIRKIQSCIDNPKDPQCTLQCTENFFADLTGETDGEKVFYVTSDRHI